MRILLAAALLAIATPVLADQTSGVVLAYDRVDHIIVMEDKTVWPLGANTVVPDDLKAGDAVTIDFTSGGESGVASVEAVIKG